MAPQPTIKEEIDKLSSAKDKGIVSSITILYNGAYNHYTIIRADSDPDSMTDIGIGTTFEEAWRDFRND